MEKERGKHKTFSFFFGIIFFVILDISVLMNWLVPKEGLFEWLFLVVMFVAACSLYLSGHGFGLSRKSSFLIAFVALLSFIIVLFFKGSIGLPII